MNISSLPASPSHAVSPLNTVDTAPVGLETRDNPQSSIKPVERTAASAGARSNPQRGEETVLQAGREASQSADDDAAESLRNASEEQTIRAKAKDLSEQRQLEQDRQRIKELSARDREVRTHEQAHAAVGGQLAGAPKYQYERGPDGVNYAVAGEVPIDVGKGASPEETLARAATIRRAALAPAEPSPQDRRVAAQAVQLEAEARRELRLDAAEERRAQESEQQSQSTQVSASSASDTANDSRGNDQPAEPSNTSVTPNFAGTPTGFTGYPGGQEITSRTGQLLNSIA